MARLLSRLVCVVLLLSVLLLLSLRGNQRMRNCGFEASSIFQNCQPQHQIAHPRERFGPLVQFDDLLLVVVAQVLCVLREADKVKDVQAQVADKKEGDRELRAYRSRFLVPN